MKGLNYFLLFALVIPALWLSSCKREPCQGHGSNTDTYIKIGDSIRSKVPHTGYDTMVFYNQYGDTVFLVGIGVQKHTVEFTYQGDPECGWGRDSYFTDTEYRYYKQDIQLSNTTRLFPLSYIFISADSNENFPPFRNGGIVILS